MNIEVYDKMEDSGEAQNNDEQVMISEDGTNDTANFNDEEAVCIQQLDETRIITADPKKLQLYEKWVPSFADDGIALQDGNLVCNICRKQVSADKKSRLTEHITSKKHKKMAALSPEERPTDYEPFTPNAKRICNGGTTASASKTYSKLDSSRSSRDKSHEILLADTLNLFVQLDVPFEKLNSEVWQSFVKKHVKNGELILKNFTFYKANN